MGPACFLLVLLATTQALASRIFTLDAQVGSVPLKLSYGRSLKMVPETWEILNAAKWNDLGKLTEVLKNGGDVNAQDFYGFSALHWAAFRDSQQVGQELINRGANINLQTTNFLWMDGLSVAAGSTPLFIAASLNRAAMAKALLDKGADQWIASSNTWVPVHRAAELGNVDVLKLLLAADGRTDTMTDQEETALHIAAFKGEQDIAAVLIGAGFNKEAKNRSGATPLHRAAANFNNGLVIRYLLEAGCDPNAQSDNGWTPLHQAAWALQDEGIQVLIDYGADIDKKDNYGETALTVASARGALTAVEILLQNGADKWIRTNGGGVAGDYICNKLISCPDWAALESLLK